MEQAQARDLHGTGLSQLPLPEQRTTTGASLSQRHLRDPAQARNCCGSRVSLGISEQTGVSQRSPLEQARCSDFHRSRYKGATTREQAQARDFCGTVSQSETSKGTGQRQ